MFIIKHLFITKHLFIIKKRIFYAVLYITSYHIIDVLFQSKSYTKGALVVEYHQDTFLF